MSRKIYGYLILSALFVMFFLAGVFAVGILKTLISLSGTITIIAIVNYAVNLISE